MYDFDFEIEIVCRFCCLAGFGFGVCGFCYHHLAAPPPSLG
jgi:hypothetical protein